MLRLEKITKDYVTSSETVHALRGVDICFRQREFVSILGPSGCGKTTLLNIIGGLDHYTSGDLFINGRSTRSFGDRDWDVYRNHRVGFIFQSYNLIPHQTVLGNVELALTIAGVSREERIERAKRALDRVGLEGQYYKKPNQLSGGQCQRVAIARALVNDPEILLADEPTGALDTVTSVQIMDLIREIADERLVIMVTHNPELAEQYSTRIVRLLDGNVVEDSNPFLAKDEIEECRLISEESERREAEAAAAEAEAVGTEAKKTKRKKTKREKAKMSFFTAFRLSARNLMSKRGRTAMVGFAGSIGIIGVAMVLAFSSGIHGYIDSMQDDLLSGNPIEITETTYDLNALTGMMDTSDKVEIIKEQNKAYINSIIEYIAKMSKVSESMIIKNEITKDYVDYIRAMDKSAYNAMTFGYGIDMNHSIYTDFDRGFGDGKHTEKISVAALTNIYTSVLKGTEFSQYASYVTQIAPSFQQAPNSTEYIASQYEVYGEIADEYDEVMLVLTKDQELSDVLLAKLGYYSEEQFYNLVYKAVGDERYDPALDVSYFDYDALVGEEKTFTWYPNDLMFKKNPDTITLPNGMTIPNTKPFDYYYNAEDITGEGVTLKVTGILIANDNTTYGSLTSGIYYTEALTNHILSVNKDSEIVDYVNSTESGEITSLNYGGNPMGIYYSYTYYPYEVAEGESDEAQAIAFVGKSIGIDDIIGSLAGGGGDSAGGTIGGGAAGGANIDMSSMKTVTARSLGGVDIANSISIYPKSFDEKDLVTDYLDAWNSEGDIAFGDPASPITLTKDERKDVKYTDALELVINMIKTMINVVTYALVAFTSISLVVSTVMIGIITYVSVVERIKEIGVIRSLGGRKKDVSYLFNAETFIIGSLSGLFGVFVTYAISLVVNAVLGPIISYSSIAALPIGSAVALVIVSIALTLISGLIPARSAANKDPVVALRTE